MRSPSLLRIFTALSSSRSRESVAWVTLSPSSDSSFANWLWERTGCRLRMSTIRRWRAVRVCGTAGPPPVCDSLPCDSVIVASVSGSSCPVGRVRGRLEDAGELLEEGLHLLVGDDQRRGEP